jgi:hypothetical protein
VRLCFPCCAFFSGLLIFFLPFLRIFFCFAPVCPVLRLFLPRIFFQHGNLLLSR